MGRKPEMLCVGLDPLLNRTRRLVLEKCFEVELAENLPQAFALLEAKRFDLVLLCYSLTDEDCRAAVQFIHRLPARPRILALAQGRERLLLKDNDEEFVMSGPAALLEKAASMANLVSDDVSQDDLEERTG